jgi:hypothetical protein
MNILTLKKKKEGRKGKRESVKDMNGEKRAKLQSI